eukprot:PhM_4_TR12716/c0_g1_i1/m.35217
MLLILLLLSCAVTELGVAAGDSTLSSSSGSSSSSSSSSASSRSSKNLYHTVFAFRSLEHFFKNGVRVYRSNATTVDALPDPEDVLGCVAVVGKYDMGKTFFLNELLELSLPSGNRYSTVGLSVYYAKMNNKWIAFVDVAGRGFRSDPRLAADLFSTERALLDAVIYLGCRVVQVIDRISEHTLQSVDEMRTRLIQVSKHRDRTRSVNVEHTVLLNAQRVQLAHDIVPEIASFISSVATLQTNESCRERAHRCVGSAEECSLSLDEQEHLLRSSAFKEVRVVGEVNRVTTYGYVWAEKGSEAGRLINDVTTCHIMAASLHEPLVPTTYRNFEADVLQALSWASSRYVALPSVTATTSLPLEELELEQEIEASEKGTCAPISKGSGTSVPLRHNIPILGVLIEYFFRSSATLMWRTRGPERPCHVYQETHHPVTLEGNNVSVWKLTAWTPRFSVDSASFNNDGVLLTVVAIEAPGCALGVNARVVRVGANSNEVMYECVLPSSTFPADSFVLPLRRGRGALEINFLSTRVTECPRLHISDHSGQTLLVFSSNCGDAAALARLCSDLGIPRACGAISLEIPERVIVVVALIVFFFLLQWLVPRKSTVWLAEPKRRFTVTFFLSVCFSVTLGQIVRCILREW